MAGLFDYLSQVQPVVMRIGFLSYQSPIIAEPILFQLQREFERKSAVVIEPFVTSSTYDLLISDEPVLVDLPCYCFHKRLYASDLQSLKQMITSLQKQKEKQATRRLEASMFSIERR